MALFRDQLNREVELRSLPRRIISLVPSQTELLYDLGLEEEVVGITKFCIHPQKWFHKKQRIGGTKTLNIEKIKELQPDLVIANKEENVEEQVEELAKGFPVWISDVNNLEEAYKMMEAIGTLTGKEAAAQSLMTKIERNFSGLENINNQLRTAYLIWKEPYMTAGGDTFIHDMLVKAGFQNIFQHKRRYPSITIDELQASDCQLLLLSSEPYPFKQKHIDELQQQLPQTKIILADGEMFSWYGSRLLHSAPYFMQLRNQLASIM